MLGIAIFKNMFGMNGVKEAGRLELLRPNVPRSKLVATLATLPVCTVTMEACSGAHPRVKTSTSSSWRHVLKSWSLRGRRGGSLRPARAGWGRPPVAAIPARRTVAAPLQRGRVAAGAALMGA
jgi:hypothetical protein